MAPSRLAAGGSVSDGSRLDGVVKKLADLAKNELGFRQDALKLNADKHKGVTFHTLDVRRARRRDDNSAMIESLIGEKVEITVGIGKESAFLAIGDKGIETIKKVIDKSEGVTETTHKALRDDRGAGPGLEVLFARGGCQPDPGSMAAGLKESGKDKSS